MKNIQRIQAVILCALTLSFSAIGEAEMQSLETSPKVKSIFYRIWSDSDFGRDPDQREVAAWIIDDDGEYICLKWPTSNARRKQIWRQARPERAIAIVHTHPVTVNPKPSIADRSVAMKLNMPVYTISTKGIWKVDPEGTPVFVQRME